MARTDRVIRALAAEEPGVLQCLLRAVLPRGVLAPDMPIEPEQVDDPHLHVPAPIEADWVARQGDDRVLHVEAQGYGETTFLDRLFQYHLTLVLRYRGRRVRTIALWLVRPTRSQRRGTITRGDVTVRVLSIVLPEVPAAMLLESQGTACFAAGGDRGDWSDEELCARVARALKEGHASERQGQMAMAAAAARGRYDTMASAMENAGVDIPDELVRIYEDIFERRGIAKGIAKGIEQGIEQGIEIGRTAGAADLLREMLYEHIEARGLALRQSHRKRIDRETSVEVLRQWHRRAATEASVGAVLRDPAAKTATARR